MARKTSRVSKIASAIVGGLKKKAADKREEKLLKEAVAEYDYKKQYDEWGNKVPETGAGTPYVSPTTPTRIGGGSSPESFDTTTEEGRTAATNYLRSIGQLGANETLNEQGQTPVQATQIKIDTQVSDYAKQQGEYYQNLINRNQMSYEKANEEYLKNVNEYNKGLIQQSYKDLGIQTGFVNPKQQYVAPIVTSTYKRQPNVFQRFEIGLKGKQIQRQMIKGEPKIDVWLKKQRGNQLPYGLQTAQNIATGNLGERERQVISGQKFSVWTPTFFLANKIVESKPYKSFTESPKVQQFVGKVLTPTITKVVEKAPRTSQVVGTIFSPANVGRTLSRGTAMLSLGSFFAPAFTTGAYQQQELEQLGKKLSKNKFEGLTKEDVKFSIEKKLIKKKTTTEQWKYLGDLYKKMTTEEAKSNFRNLVNEMINDGIIRNPLKVEVTPTGNYWSGIQKVPNRFEAVGNVATGNEVIFDFNRLPVDLKGAGILTSETGLFSKEITGQLDKVYGVTKKVSIPVLTYMTILGLKNVSGQKQGGGSKVGTTNISGTIQIQPQPQVLVQPQPQINIQKLRQINLLKTNQLQKQLQLQKQTYKFKQPTVTILKLPKAITFISKSKPKSKDIFGAFIKRYKKDISLGSFKELKGAKTKLVSELKSTLGASGFITKGKSKVPVKELELGYEFTPAKKDMFRVVQKRGFRLGTRSEVSEILSAKRAKGRKIKWL